jgi:hypothetical protein
MVRAAEAGSATKLWPSGLIFGRARHQRKPTCGRLAGGSGDVRIRQRRACDYRDGASGALGMAA